MRGVPNPYLSFPGKGKGFSAANYNALAFDGYEAVIDISNYSGSLTTQQLDGLVNLGFRSVIVGTQNLIVAQRQIEQIRADGRLWVRALYVFVYWDAFGPGDDLRRIDQAVFLANKHDLPVWLDCEWVTTNNHLLDRTDTPMPSSIWLRDAIRRYRSILRNHYQGIYTGAWWWPRYVGNWTDLADMGDPLWHADYIEREPTPTDFDNFRSYGGWHRPLAWQYSSGGAADTTCDLSIEEIPVAPAPTPDPEYSQDQLFRGVVKAMVENYDYKVLAKNEDDGHLVVQLLHKDGSPETGGIVAVYL